MSAVPVLASSNPNIFNTPSQPSLSLFLSLSLSLSLSVSLSLSLSHSFYFPEISKSPKWKFPEFGRGRLEQYPRSFKASRYPRRGLGELNLSSLVGNLLLVERALRERGEINLSRPSWLRDEALVVSPLSTDSTGSGVDELSVRMPKKGLGSGKMNPRRKMIVNLFQIRIQTQ